MSASAASGPSRLHCASLRLPGVLRIVWAVAADPGGQPVTSGAVEKIGDGVGVWQSRPCHAPRRRGWSLDGKPLYLGGRQHSYSLPPGPRVAETVPCISIRGFRWSVEGADRLCCLATWLFALPLSWSRFHTPSCQHLRRREWCRLSRSVSELRF